MTIIAARQAKTVEKVDDRRYSDGDSGADRSGISETTKITAINTTTEIGFRIFASGVKGVVYIYNNKKREINVYYSLSPKCACAPARGNDSSLKVATRRAQRTITAPGCLDTKEPQHLLKGEGQQAPGFMGTIAQLIDQSTNRHPDSWPQGAPTLDRTAPRLEAPIAHCGPFLARLGEDGAMPESHKCLNGNRYSRARCDKMARGSSHTIRLCFFVLPGPVRMAA